MITIQSFTVPNYQGGGATATLYISANDSFTASDGTPVLRNFSNSGVFYKTVSCTVSGTTLTVPSFTINSTTDSSVVNATYNGNIHDSNNLFKQALFSAFKVPDSLGSTITWAQWDIYNTAPRHPLPTVYPTIEDVQILIDAASSNVVSLANTYGNSLVTAVASIGAIPTTLLIDEDTTISSAITIPSTLILKVEGQSLIIDGGGTLDFDGIGLTDPESQTAIFSGFSAGDITWTGTTYPKRLSTNLWSSADVMAKIANATAAMSGNETTLVAYPGNFVTRSTLKTGHSLHLTAGDYQRTNTEANQTLLFLEDNTCVYGDGMTATRIYSPNADTSATMFTASGMNTVGLDGPNENIEIRDLTLINATPTQVYSDNGGSAILLGNCINGHVRRVMIKDYPAYGVYIGGFPTQGYFPDGCSITNCVFDNCRGQNVGFLNGRNVTISNNILINPQLDAAAAFITLIDIEPNSDNEIVENLTITGNLIDCRAALQNCNAIVIQTGGNLAGCVRGLVADNIIIGPTTGKMSNGILVSGTRGFLVQDNYIKSAAQSGLSVYSNRDSVYANNVLDSCGSGGSAGIVIYNTANTVFDGNKMLHPSLGASDQNLLEDETEWLFNSTGSTIERKSNGTFSGIVFIDYFAGLTINANGTDYVIDTIPSSTTLTTTIAIGTVVFKTLASATDVDAGTDTLTSAAHGFNNGCKLRYQAGTVAIGGLTDGADYYVVNKAANTFQLSLTSGGGAIDITGTGTGNQLFHPVMTSVFSSNEYVQNRIPHGITLSSTGSSKIISDAQRVVTDSYAPAQITVDQNDYKPTDPFAYRFDLSTSASKNITGWVSAAAYPDYYKPVDGEKHLLYNAGSNDIVLKHQSASSAAAGRFINSTGADITLTAGQAADMEYNSTLTRWMVFKRS